MQQHLQFLKSFPAAQTALSEKQKTSLMKMQLFQKSIEYLKGVKVLRVAIARVSLI
jgi:hypothetical protein